MKSFISKNFQKIQNRAFFALLLLVLGLTVYMFGPYLMPVMWAAVLASVFYPLYLKILSALKNANWSALVTTVAIFLIVIIPVSLLATSLVRELVRVYEYLSSPETIESVTDFLEDQRENGLIGSYLEGANVQERIEETVGTIGSSLVNIVRQGSAFTLSFLAKGFIMLYTLFFFLRDGEKLLLKLERLLPFGDKNERELYRRFTSTSKATLKGSVFMAVIQGLIAGIGFLIVGFPSVVFFMLLTMFLAIIPALGASFVLVPAAIYLFFTAPLWQALVLLAFALFINLSENVIRPKVVGEDVEMHPVLFLISTLGGISLFGISGLVFGPIVASFLLALLEIYEERFKKDIDKEERNGTPSRVIE